MTYSVTLTPQATRDVEDLTTEVRKSVYAVLRLLEDDPRPPGVQALRGELAGNYRLRVGNHRLGYSIDDQARVVDVWHVGDRKRFYERAKRRRR